MHCKPAVSFWSSATKCPFCRCAIIALWIAPVLMGREWTDNTGKHSIEAELLTVRNEKAYLERRDGSVVAIPIVRLSKSDQAYIRQRLTPPKAPGPQTDPLESKPHEDSIANAHAPNDSPSDPEISKRAFSSQVATIMRKACFRCHGEEGASEGGFNYALDLSKIARTYVTPGDPENSYLFERLTDPDADSRMPPLGAKPALNASEINIVGRWIETGALVEKTKQQSWISPERVMSTVLHDLQSAAPADRQFFRYLSLVHLRNIGVTDSELATYRLAVAKLINSLSWHPALHKPQPLDPAETILRIDLRLLQWDAALWQRIAVTNPYELHRGTQTELECKKLTQSTSVLLRADWFIHAASQPPLYHVILGVPGTDRELEQRLGVDVEANISQSRAVRAGFNRSGVSQNNRMIERHETQHGSYWKSYDFAGNAGLKNLFAHPLGPLIENGAFEHDGGEIIFSLPNGLQGYMLTDASGLRINKGPTEIVSDPQRPDRAVLNGVSCMSCHYAGMIRKADEIRSHVESNAKSFESPEEILRLYRNQARLDGLYQEDGARFTASLKGIGINRITRTAEPVSVMAARFESDLDELQAAAELGLKTEEFRSAFRKTPVVTKLLQSLSAKGGSIKREAFQKAFPHLVTALKLGEGFAAAGVLPVNINAKPDAGGRIMAAQIKSRSYSHRFSPDGGTFVFGTSDGLKLQVYDLNTSKRTEELDVGWGHFEFTSDGKTLIVARTNQIETFDLATRPVQRIGTVSVPNHRFRYSTLATIHVSPDGRHLFLAYKSEGTTNPIAVYDVAALKQVGSLDIGRLNPVAMRFVHDTQALYVSDAKTVLRFDSIQSPSLIAPNLERTLKVLQPSRYARRSAEGIAISPDGGRIAAVDFSSNLTIWDSQSGRELFATKSGGGRFASFSTDGKFLLTGTSRKTSLWDIDSKSLIREFPVAKDIPTAAQRVLVVSPDGRHFASVIDEDFKGNGRLEVFRISNTPGPQSNLDKQLNF